MSNERRPSPVPKQFLGAFKCGHRASAREFIDDELSYHLLSKILDSKWTDQEAIAELDYITKFNNEYHKNVIKKGDPDALHNTDELRKDCYARENSRNRDISSIQKNDIISLSPLVIEDETNDMMLADQRLNRHRDLSAHEDVLIQLLEEHWKTKDK